jgi:hypothetical protein
VSGATASGECVGKTTFITILYWCWYFTEMGIFLVEIIVITYWRFVGLGGNL